MRLLKTWSWTGILLIGFFIACENYDFHKMSGMWQLKIIVDDTGNRYAVDTVYCSFQNDAFFSYTIVNTKIDNLDAGIILYGYVDFPAKDQVRIQLDSQYGTDYWMDVINALPWKVEPQLIANLQIVKLTGKELVLKQDEIVCHFIKF